MLNNKMKKQNKKKSKDEIPIIEKNINTKKLLKIFDDFKKEIEYNKLNPNEIDYETTYN